MQDDSFNCMDCGIDTSLSHEYYMVRNRVWLQANPQGDGMLCIGCLEESLGRQLTFKDFTNAPLNRPGGWTQSERLINRINTK